MEYCVRGIIFLIFLISGNAGVSQQYFYNDKYYDASWLIEAGVSAGAMNAFTDLGGRKGRGSYFIKDLNWRNTKSCFGIHAGTLYNYVIGFQIEYNRGRVSAQDSILKNQEGPSRLRYQRNLHFRSSIQELNSSIEWHFWRTFRDTERLSPYIIAGLGYFKFRPQALLKNQWVDLQPLHTEGQGFGEYGERANYALQQVNVPIGLGLQFEISALLNLKLELVNRFLFTDYLDDVSKNYIDPALFIKYLDPATARLATLLADRRQELDPFQIRSGGDKRGNPDRKDSYFSFALKTSLILNRKRR